MAAAPAAFGAPFRRERSGGRGAAQLAWLESPEQGLTGFVHIVLNS